MPERLAGVSTRVVVGGDRRARLERLRTEARDLVAAGERVAVLLAAGRIGGLASDAGLTVASAPGGCACCAGRLPFQVGLNRLLREVRPSALLIELAPPAHVQAILALLREGDYRAVLDPCVLLEVDRSAKATSG